VYNPNPKVPEVSRFLGIVIAMYFDDHPPPHFHAFYSDREVVIRIRDGVVTAGDFPKRALAPLDRIAPLE
jgi:hypothetical protein